MKRETNNRRAVVACQIKEAMEIRGMNRKQLADAVGRTPSDVTKWLGGNHNFTIDLLDQISAAVGVPITGVDGSVNASGAGVATRCADGFLRDQDGCGYGMPSPREAPGENKWNAWHQRNDVGLSAVGPVGLPSECVESLERKASACGQELQPFIRDVLLREASVPALRAADFCGIWKDIDPNELRSHRSGHRKVEEL